jgi:hypothetical protein
MTRAELISWILGTLKSFIIGLWHDLRIFMGYCALDPRDGDPSRSIAVQRLELRLFQLLKAMGVRWHEQGG